MKYKKYFGKLFTFNNQFILNILSIHLFRVKLQNRKIEPHFHLT
jgi:hypothetical protein